MLVLVLRICEELLLWGYFMSLLFNVLSYKLCMVFIDISYIVRKEIFSDIYLIC